ncbi:MAG: glycine C-acetyltransferase [Elusimicrobia bacterium]|nr:glycine C-acetyltransferase [Elusimicrobiota bacterium]
MKTAVYPALDFLKEELSLLEQEGRRKPLRILSTAQLPVSIIDGKEVINLSSNNYLGLAAHPKLKEAAKKAVDQYGVGPAAVRPIIGTQTIHKRLEERLARFKGTPAATLLTSGFTTNVAVVQTLLDNENDLLVSDELNHASIIDGGRLSRAKRFVYPHRNIKALEEILEKNAAGTRRRMIVTDGVFSMDGDVAPLPEILKTAEKFDAVLMVDDAHATGVMGPNGRGTPSHFGLTEKIPIQIGTLSKAVAAVGGYVASTKEMQEILYHKARPFLFTSSPPASVAASCLAALDILETEPSRIERLWKNAEFFKGELKKMGFDTGASETPITPVIVGDTDKARKFEGMLFAEGVFALSIVFPTVARGRERLRTIVSSEHTQEHLNQALSAFRKTGRALGLI